MEFVQPEMKVIKPDRAILRSPESLEKYWDEFCNTQKDDYHCIKEPFLMFPKGTNDLEICKWFNKMYPDGLLVLMKKRLTNKFGEEYVKDWERLGIILENNTHFNDALNLTEEDKKRLLKEFAADKEE